MGKSKTWNRHRNLETALIEGDEPSWPFPNSYGILPSGCDDVLAP